MELNDLLVKCGIDPKTVLVLRHVPTEREFRKVLPWLAAERHDVYNCVYRKPHPHLID
jgi:metal-dependent HD superfamily phosphatase/phosphodiesterase